MSPLPLSATLTAMRSMHVYHATPVHAKPRLLRKLLTLRVMVYGAVLGVTAVHKVMPDETR